MSDSLTGAYIILVITLATQSERKKSRTDIGLIYLLRSIKSKLIKMNYEYEVILFEFSSTNEL